MHHTNTHHTVLCRAVLCCVCVLSCRAEHFTTCEGDRPLFVQFCANDPDIFVASAALVQVWGRGAAGCSAVEGSLQLLSLAVVGCLKPSRRTQASSKQHSAIAPKTLPPLNCKKISHNTI
jgi:hypothetical protein